MFENMKKYEVIAELIALVSVVLSMIVALIKGENVALSMFELIGLSAVFALGETIMVCVREKQNEGK